MSQPNRKGGVLTRAMFDALIANGFGGLTLSDVERLRDVLPLLVFFRRGAA